TCATQTYPCTFSESVTCTDAAAWSGVTTLTPDALSWLRISAAIASASLAVSDDPFVTLNETAAGPVTAAILLARSLSAALQFVATEAESEQQRNTAKRRRMRASRRVLM